MLRSAQAHQEPAQGARRDGDAAAVRARHEAARRARRRRDALVLQPAREGRAQRRGRAARRGPAAPGVRLRAVPPPRRRAGVGGGAAARAQAARGPAAAGADRRRAGRARTTASSTPAAPLQRRPRRRRGGRGGRGGRAARRRRGRRARDLDDVFRYHCLVDALARRTRSATGGAVAWRQQADAEARAAAPADGPVAAASARRGLHHISLTSKTARVFTAPGPRSRVRSARRRRRPGRERPSAMARRARSANWASNYSASFFLYWRSSAPFLRVTRRARARPRACVLPNAPCACAPSTASRTAARARARGLRPRARARRSRQPRPRARARPRPRRPRARAPLLVRGARALGGRGLGARGPAPSALRLRSAAAARDALRLEPVARARDGLVPGAARAAAAGAGARHSASTRAPSARSRVARGRGRGGRGRPPRARGRVELLGRAAERRPGSTTTRCAPAAKSRGRREPSEQHARSPSSRAPAARITTCATRAGPSSAPPSSTSAPPPRRSDAAGSNVRAWQRPDPRFATAARGAHGRARGPQHELADEDALDDREPGDLAPPARGHAAPEHPLGRRAARAHRSGRARARAPAGARAACSATRAAAARAPQRRRVAAAAARARARARRTRRRPRRRRRSRPAARLAGRSSPPSSRRPPRPARRAGTRAARAPQRAELVARGRRRLGLARGRAGHRGGEIGGVEADVANDDALEALRLAALGRAQGLLLDRRPPPQRALRADSTAEAATPAEEATPAFQTARRGRTAAGHDGGGGGCLSPCGPARGESLRSRILRGDLVARRTGELRGDPGLPTPGDRVTDRRPGRPHHFCKTARSR